MTLLIDQSFRPKGTLKTHRKYKSYTAIETNEQDDIRIMDRRLVLCSNIPESIAKPEILKQHQYFGQYGTVQKINLKQHPYINSFEAFVGYSSQVEAATAIVALNGYDYQDCNIRVTYGATRYCSRFLKDIKCPFANCIYEHKRSRDEFNINSPKYNKYSESIVDDAKAIVKANLKLIKHKRIYNTVFPSIEWFILENTALVPGEHRHHTKPFFKSVTEPAVEVNIEQRIMHKLRIRSRSKLLSIKCLDEESRTSCERLLMYLQMEYCS